MQLVIVYQIISIAPHGGAANLKQELKGLLKGESRHDNQKNHWKKNCDTVARRAIKKQTVSTQQYNN